MMPAVSEPPLILVTNDDGVQARGLRVLTEALEGLGEVVVVAPDRNQSAVAHKITLHEPLRVETLAENRHAVDGTPVDCVYLALHDLLPRPPALVLSGINAGPNLGFDVHYSGTVGGAVEGTLQGIPSIAVSLLERHGDYTQAARFSRALAEGVLARGLPWGVTLNVNVPPGEPRRARLCALGRRRYSHSVHRREDPRGGVYYWIGGAPTDEHEAPDSDCEAVRQGLIAVTPLHLDLTHPLTLWGELPALEFRDFDFEAILPR